MNRGVPPVEITAPKGISASAEQVFDLLLQESVTDVFNGVLGKIGGQALLDAIRMHSSLEARDFPRKPDLLDQALEVLLGSTAKVLERRILKTLAAKTSIGVAPLESDQFDFASEVEAAKKQFLRRKQAGSHPPRLE